ncbi:hypothetical protein P8452_54567 [Trifolium repens]|jgi:hypothetical protein|nr:LOB domain-containing protein [Trifolium repens]WJX70455.1 hypothetical protein P8452_54567 [Trifolium repens]
MDIQQKRKACAACKYQRRGCSRNCLLAPYFPADKPKELLNAVRLFGISNIRNTLKEIKDDRDKNNMMKSIIFESDMRARYPIHGCLGIIKMYEGMIKESLQELDHVEELLSLCKLLQQQNLLHFFSMDPSLVPSTSSQIPNFPICNNDGNILSLDVNNQVLGNLDDNNTSCMQNYPLQQQNILPYFSTNHSSVPSTNSQISDILPYFSMNHSLVPSPSSQIPNIVPYFSMNHSSVPSTSSQIPNFPISNNVGDIISHDVNNTTSDTTMIAEFSGGDNIAQGESDHDHELDFHGGVFIPKDHLK